MELISVIIPVFNAENYLEKCIESVLSQTYQNIEIILINDGSTDLSGAICDYYAKKNSNILVKHLKNCGVSIARNEGIELAKGELIAFVDSDDYIDNRMFETLYTALINTNSDIAICGRNLVSNNRIKSNLFTLNNIKTYDSLEAIKEMMLMREFDTAVWDKLFRAKLFKDNKFPVGRRVNEETIVVYNCLRNSEKVVHVGKPLYFYNIGNQSTTRSNFSPKFIDSIYASNELLRSCEKYTSELIDYAIAFNVNVCLGVIARASENLSKENINIIKQIRSNLGKDIVKILINPNVKLTHKILLTSVLLSIRLFKIEREFINFIR